MFDIGFWELFLIGIVALLIVGPERLPELARTLGLWTGKVRNWAQEIKFHIDHEVKLAELKDNIRKATDVEKNVSSSSTPHD